MRIPMLAGSAALALALGACDNAAKPDAANADSPAAEAGGGATIADQLGEGTATFAKAAEAAGINETLDGPGPYTVALPVSGFVPLAVPAWSTAVWTRIAFVVDESGGLVSRFTPKCSAHSWSISATTPVTAGVAMEVPPLER